MPDQNESLTNEYSRFNSWRDYEYFLRLVKNSPEFEEVPVRKPYSNVGGFVQFWYRHRPTGRVYRLEQVTIACVSFVVFRETARAEARGSLGYTHS